MRDNSILSSVTQSQRYALNFNLYSSIVYKHLRDDEKAIDHGHLRAIPASIRAVRAGSQPWHGIPFCCISWPHEPNSSRGSHGHSSSSWHTGASNASSSKFDGPKSCHVANSTTDGATATTTRHASFETADTAREHWRRRRVTTLRQREAIPPHLEEEDGATKARRTTASHHKRPETISP